MIYRNPEDQVIETQVDTEVKPPNLENDEVGMDPDLPTNYNVSRIEDVSVPGPVNPNESVGLDRAPVGPLQTLPPVLREAVEREDKLRPIFACARAATPGAGSAALRPGRDRAPRRARTDPRGHRANAELARFPGPTPSLHIVRRA